MTTIYFIRHAESDISVRDPHSRPLTEKGKTDRALVTEFLSDKKIDAVYSSPYVRAVDTVSDFAVKFGLKINITDDFRERKSDGKFLEKEEFASFMKKQWEDFSYTLSDGECLLEVQKRNINSLNKLLSDHENENIVIGTHGTALSTIINHYDGDYGYEDFMNMINIMPWVVIMTFDKQKNIGIKKIDLFNDVYVRSMSADDYNAAYDLWLNTPGMGLNDVNDSKDGIAKYLSRNPGSCFIAIKSGRMVGVILSGHDGRRGFIYHMAVLEEERRKGIGSLLLDLAVSALKKEGISKIALLAKDNNKTGNIFWEKKGFKTRDDVVYRDISLFDTNRIDT